MHHDLECSGGDRAGMAAGSPCSGAGTHSVRPALSTGAHAALERVGALRASGARRNIFRASPLQWTMRRFRGTTRRLWFALAVSSGLSLSLCNLAGADQVAAKKAWTAKDYQTAFQEYSSLAEAGDALAQFFLGTMYSAGQHVPQNPAAAFRWWREAADQGYGPAQVRVAVAYFRGTGVAVDVGEAFHWA